MMDSSNKMGELSLKGSQRRDFFKLAAVGGAAFAVTSCANDPVETLVPLLNPPADLVSGEFMEYASSCNECAAGCGVLVRTREGRVINLSGNPTHPISQGGICSIGQSSVQEHYSPARVLSPLQAGTALGWKDADALVTKALSEKKKIALITRPGKTATKTLLAQFAKDRGIEVVEFETNPYQSLVRANQANFGVAEVPFYDLKAAQTLVVFGADFLESWHSVVENSRGFADFHSLKNGKKGKYFHFSPHLSLTASNADKWFACPAGSETEIALALCGLLLKKTSLADALKKKIIDSYSFPDPETVAKNTGVSAEHLAKVAEAFGVDGQGIAMAGGIASAQPNNASLQAATNLLNFLGGSINSTVKFGGSYSLAGDDVATVGKVLNRAAAGELDLLILDRVNLLQAWPDKALVTKALGNVSLSLGLYSIQNETAKLCQLVLPLRTSLESWDVIQPKVGVVNLQQAAMVPLPGNLAEGLGDMLLRWAKVLGLKNSSYTAENFQTFVQSYYQSLTGNQKEDFWVSSVMKGGYYSDTPFKKVNFQPSGAKLAKNKTDESLALVVFNSNLRNANALTANRGWLDEIGHPISQLAWDSWAEIHPETAAGFKISHGDEIEISTDKGKLVTMAYVYHGVHKGSIAVPAGWGNKLLFPEYSSRRGLLIPFTADDPKVLKEIQVGENINDLLTPNTLGGDLVFAGTVSITKTGKQSAPSAYDGQWRDDIYAEIDSSKARYGDRSQKGRGMYRRMNLSLGGEGEEKEPDRHFHVKEGTPFNFYLPVEDQMKPENVGLGLTPNNPPTWHDPYRFGMTIDLDRCTGCSACVVACYAENNIPVVGKDRVRYQRQMNWIRIERYFDPDENGEMVTNLGPNACQQCSNAGCEPVCPVYATYHNPDGLNAQVYNRCVGTRYCSNNCVYKVRRFNWRTYEFPYPLNMQLNPDVSVRTKGVMEKCTLCVQRIRRGKDKAKDEGRIMGDGEVQTACQSVCPTGAITFGNLADKDSAISKLNNTPRGYHQLEDLNFQSALTYLSRTQHKEVV